MTTTAMSSIQSTGALAQVRAELMELPIASLRSVNLDIQAMVVTIFGALPRLRALRPQVVSELGERHAAAIDRLELDAQAAAQADAEYLITGTNTAAQELSAEVLGLREMLLADARALVVRKQLPRESLGALRGTVGFNNQVGDLLQLIAVFRRHWTTVGSVTPVTLEELDRAEAFARRFLDALGARERGQATTAARADLRQRAYTKVLQTYDRVRRAVSFLRWDEGDADTVAPSLWAGRGGRGGRRARQASAAAPSATLTEG